MMNHLWEIVRVFFDPYHREFGNGIIVLLIGWSKRTQEKDVKREKALAAPLDE